MPEFGVKLSIHRDRDVIDVILCYECAILLIYRGDQSVGDEHFDGGYRPLVRAAKTAFPDDAAIQGLRDE